MIFQINFAWVDESAFDVIVKDATIVVSSDPDVDVSLQMQSNRREYDLAIATTLQIGVYQMKAQTKSYCDEIDLTITKTLQMGIHQV